MAGGRYLKVAPMTGATLRVRSRPPFHPDDGRPRYVGPATVVFPGGREVSVTASLVLRLAPSKVENFSYDRHSTWAGTITLVHDEDGVDLFDAAPGILRMPDGRESEFMATGGGAGESGCSGLGPLPSTRQGRRCPAMATHRGRTSGGKRLASL